MRVVENKGITLLYISNGIHFKLSSLSAKKAALMGCFFALFEVIPVLLTCQL